MTDMARMRRTPTRSTARAESLTLKGSDPFRLRVVLFRQDILRRIGEGEVTLAFRRWRKPTVRAGGTLRTGAGVLAIESVDVVDESDVTDSAACRAGAAAREAVLREGPRERPLYRIAFMLAGPD